MDEKNRQNSILIQPNNHNLIHMTLNLKRSILVLSIIIVSIGIDQYSKVLAKTHLAPLNKDYTYLGDSFRLTYVQNDGAFLSWGSDFPELLQIIALKIFPIIMLTGLLLYTLFSKALNRTQIIAFSFILGGGISNIYDRLTIGSVIDFMNMGIGNLRTGIFNIADMAIMLGLFLMLPYLFKKQPQDEPKDNEEVSQTA